MQFLNYDFSNFINEVRGKRIIFFGTGLYLKNFALENLPEEIIKSVEYAVDNGNSNEIININEKEICVYKPEKLATEKECIIVILSAKYAYEMYQQIKDMNLPDSVICYSLPHVFAATSGNEDVELKKTIFQQNKTEKINKIIHSFWFSGDKKPELYQMCIDSWNKYCPDYKIYEWNMTNYDYKKNKFMYQAIQKKKWAFASDYARLDVVNEFGGIYLDMDFELVASPNALLNHDAFFSFDTHNNIDLATFGAVKGNSFVTSILDLYKDIDFVDQNGNFDMEFYCQPKYIREKLNGIGIKMDGSLQKKDDMIFLPRKYLSPLDSVAYEKVAFTEETIGIHHFNIGWVGGDYRNQRIVNNRKLLEQLSVK